jgi:hypothetical protein
MKKIPLILTVILTILATGHTQITEETRTMALGVFPSIGIDIPHATTKMVESEWKTFMSKYGKVKKVKRAEETVVSGAQVLNIGGVNLLDIYARTEETDSAARQVIWIDMGDSTFVSSEGNKDTYDGTVAMLQDFAHHVKVEIVKAEVEEQKKVLSKLQSDMDKLLQTNDRLHRNIDNANERIADAQNDIPNNLKDQENLEKKIENETDAKARSKLTRRLTKLRKRHEGYNKTISKSRETIIKAEADIEHNLEEQEIRKQEIEAQKQVVEAANLRLEEVRAEKGSLEN